MPFKINISEKSGKTYKLELESEEFIGKKLHDKIQGKSVFPDLEGYEFEITGASDKSGFTAHEDVPGIGLKRPLLTYGKGMKRRPRKEGKIKVSNPTPGGLRLRKTVRGHVISPEIVQINLKTVKEGSKKLSEVFPDQNKSKEAESSEGAETQKVEETPQKNDSKQGSKEEKGESKPEEKKEGKKEEKTEEQAKEAEKPKSEEKKE